jgi:hypothetical protein
MCIKSLFSWLEWEFFLCIDILRRNTVAMRCAFGVGA